MAEAVDELLVRLGLETDAESFRDANNMFSNLRSTALMTGAAVAAGFAGTTKAAIDFANAKAKLGDFADYMGEEVGYIDKLSLAMQNAGGSAEDALSLITQVDQLMRQAQRGELPEWAFTVPGFNPGELMNFDSIEGAIDWMAQRFSEMDADTRRMVGSELGIDQHPTNMLGNYAKMQEDFADAERYGITDQGMVEDSRELVEALTEVRKAFSGITDDILEEFLPAMSKWTKETTDWLVQNREGLVKAGEYAANVTPETAIEDTKRLAQDEDIRNLIRDAWNSYVEYYTPLRMIRDAWGNDNESDVQAVDPTGAVYLQSILRDNARRAKEIGVPGPVAGADGLSADEMGYEPSASETIPDLRSQVESGEYTPSDYEYLRNQVRQFAPEQYGLNVGPPNSTAYQPQMASRTLQINVDASGSTDPAMTETRVRNAIREEVGRMSQMSQDDFPDNVA